MKPSTRTTADDAPTRHVVPKHHIYNHFGLGPQQLAIALRLHWAMAYLFMLNGALYLVGLAAGGG